MIMTDTYILQFTWLYSYSIYDNNFMSSLLSLSTLLSMDSFWKIYNIVVWNESWEGRHMLFLHLSGCVSPLPSPLSQVRSVADSGAGGAGLSQGRWLWSIRWGRWVGGHWGHFTPSPSPTTSSVSDWGKHPPLPLPSNHRSQILWRLISNLFISPAQN